MGTFLFDKIIFGPVQSRRLGISLGVNILPVGCKICNFDCVYCECGLSVFDEELDKLNENIDEILHILLNYLDGTRNYCNKIN